MKIIRLCLYNKKFLKFLKKMLWIKKIVVSLHRSKQDWCRSSVWLECLPVTQEVDGSSPFGTAKME